MGMPAGSKFVTNGKWDPLYKAWVSMRDRCNNPNCKQYKDWGGRGIKVCARWDSYNFFAADMGPHPGNGMTLDRRNNNGNYCKSNCRWVPRLVQGRNSRQAKLGLQNAQRMRTDYATGRHTQEGLAYKYGVSKGTVYYVLHNMVWVV